MKTAPSILLNETDLSRWLGYERSGDIERWLKKRNIRYDKGQGGRLVTLTTEVEKAFTSDPDFDIQ